MSAKVDFGTTSNGTPYTDYKATERSAEPWDIWTTDRIYADLPPIDWLVPNLIPSGTLGMICAYGSSLKSWIELDLLDALSRGRPWLDLFDCAQGSVFFVDYEAGAYETRRRLQSIARGLDTSKGELITTPNIRFVTMPPTFLPTDEFIKRLEPFARECRLICIDTLAAGSPGVDENDSRFAMPLYQLKALAERTGCTIVVLHHTRKPVDGEDERATTRGTSAIFNALDWEMKIARSKDDETLFVVKVDKARGFKAPDPFTVHVRDVRPDAVQVVAERLAPAPSGKTREAVKGAADMKRISELQEDIVKAAVESRVPLNTEKLLAALRANGVQFTQTIARAALHAALQSGRIVNDGTDRRPVYKRAT